jgi:hypothetical protein
LRDLKSTSETYVYLSLFLFDVLKKMSVVGSEAVGEEEGGRGCRGESGERGEGDIRKSIC